MAGGPVTLDARSVRELATVHAGLKAFPREISSEISRQMRRVADPAWIEELNRSGPNRLQRRVLVATARTSVTATRARLIAGSNRGRLEGGYTGTRPSEIARATEFGADPNLYSKYRRGGRRTKPHTVTRRTRKALGPIRANGKVVYPAFARIAPRIGALVVQTFVFGLHKALEGRR